jgi:hypothetical protein
MRLAKLRGRHSNLAKLLALFCIGLTSGHSMHAQALRQWTELENLALRGPVHTVETTSRVLNPAPESGLFFPDSAGTVWMEFDSHGSLLAQGQDVSNKDQVPRNLYVYDEQGRMVVKRVWAGDRVTMIRQEYKYGPFGPVEALWYSGKTLTGRTTVEYDANGNFTRDASFDPEGKLLHESLHKEDPRMNSVEDEGIDEKGTIEVHFFDRLDPKTGIHEHQSLDPKGHVVGILRLHDGEFYSWWEIPDFQCDAGQREVGIFNWNEEERRFQIYFNLRCPRTLEITKLHHAGEAGSLENDHEERYLEDGTQLARVEYEYERDTHENRTKRVVLVWDAKEDKMIPVQEDQRTISYFDDKKAK